jgi:succinate dehydrogenase / fumarate reductase, flavoprotein subunit
MRVRRTPYLLPRDEVARAINSEVKAGRGSPHGGVFLDIASRHPGDYIQRRLPSMYHQFKELADVDITKEPMEVGPTCHYAMGGVRVNADTQESTIPGLFAAGECAGGMHGANRLGGNSLSDLLVFGKRAGEYAAASAKEYAETPEVHPAELDAIAATALRPLSRAAGENPYEIHADLQETMQNLVGIIRREDELQKALEEIATLKERAQRTAVPGDRRYNPGWNLALDLQSMLTVAECSTLAALERKESRGGHTRDDFPATDPEFAKVNVVLRDMDGGIAVALEPLPEIPDELRQILEEEPT